MIDPVGPAGFLLCGLVVNRLKIVCCSREKVEMGIRFACHVCGKHLNIKKELAGKRGICPACSSRFRIPKEDTDQSTPIEEGHQQPAESRSPGPSGPNETANAQQSTSSSVQATHTPQALSATQLLVSDPNATWYVRPPSGGQYGPANGEILKQWISEGRVATNALIWRDGWPEWREAADALPDLLGTLPKSETALDLGKVATEQEKSNTPSTASETESRPEQTRSTEANQNSRAAKSSTGWTQENRVSSQEPVTRSNNAAESKPVAKVNGDTFGYEDSDFANGKSYSNPSGKSTNFTGQAKVGAQRRKKSNQRTMSIVILGIIALLLVTALIFIISGQAS